MLHPCRDYLKQTSNTAWHFCHAVWTSIIATQKPAADAHYKYGPTSLNHEMCAMLSQHGCPLVGLFMVKACTCQGKPAKRHADETLLTLWSHEVLIKHKHGQSCAGKVLACTKVATNTGSKHGSQRLLSLRGSTHAGESIQHACLLARRESACAGKIVI